MWSRLVGLHIEATPDHDLRYAVATYIHIKICEILSYCYCIIYQAMTLCLAQINIHVYVCCVYMARGPVIQGGKQAGMYMHITTAHEVEPEQPPNMACLCQHKTYP